MTKSNDALKPLQKQTQELSLVERIEAAHARLDRLDDEVAAYKSREEANVQKMERLEKAIAQLEGRSRGR